MTQPQTITGNPKDVPQPGFRYFQCDDCKREWIEESRDRTSPSGDECSKCGAWVGAVPATTAQFDRLRGAWLIELKKRPDHAT